MNIILNEYYVIMNIIFKLFLTEGGRRDYVPQLHTTENLRKIEKRNER